MRPSCGSADLLHLRASGVSLVLEVRGGLPAVVHWGHDLGDLGPDDLAALAAVGVPSTVPNDLDEAARVLSPCFPSTPPGGTGGPACAAPGRGEDGRRSSP